MCAIFGFVANRRGRLRIDVLRTIVAANIGRGPHAFGFAWIDSRGILRSYKQSGRLTDALGVLAMTRDARMLVGHLRWATHGSPDQNINNHPHPCDGGWLVHNGIVHNYRALSLRGGVHTVSECDSEVIAQLIETGEGSRLARSVSAARAVDGNQATLALWPRPATLIAVRRGNPLHISRTDGGIYLATDGTGLPGKVVPMQDNRAARFVLRDGEPVITAARVPAPQIRREVLWGSSLYCGG